MLVCCHWTRSKQRIRCVSAKLYSRIELVDKNDDLLTVHICIAQHFTQCEMTLNASMLENICFLCRWQFIICWSFFRLRQTLCLAKRILFLSFMMNWYVTSNVSIWILTVSVQLFTSILLFIRHLCINDLRLLPWYASIKLLHPWHFTDCHFVACLVSLWASIYCLVQLTEHNRIKAVQKSLVLFH